MKLQCESVLFVLGHHISPSHQGIQHKLWSPVQLGRCVRHLVSHVSDESRWPNIPFPSLQTIITSSTRLDGSTYAGMWKALRRWTTSSRLPRLSSEEIQRRSRRQWCLMLIIKTWTGSILSSWKRSKYTTLILLNPLVLSARHLSLLVTLKSKYILSTTKNKMEGIRQAWWPLVILMDPISTLNILASSHFIISTPLYYYLNWITLIHLLVISVTITWLDAQLRRLYSMMDTI